MNTVRKRLLSEGIERAICPAGEIDIIASATIAYSSEKRGHPVNHIFDRSHGSGATRWIAAQPDTTSQIVVEFDRAQAISRLVFEVEETEMERTQEVRIEALCDGENVYRTILMQQYTFSPAGSTYQREDLHFVFSAVARLRLTIVPNQRGHGSATLTGLQVFS
jgi:hypothetical protein